MTLGLHVSLNPKFFLVSIHVVHCLTSFLSILNSLRSPLFYIPLLGLFFFIAYMIVVNGLNVKYQCHQPQAHVFEHLVPRCSCCLGRWVRNSLLGEEQNWQKVCLRSYQLALLSTKHSVSWSTEMWRILAVHPHCSELCHDRWVSFMYKQIFDLFCL